MTRKEVFGCDATHHQETARQLSPQGPSVLSSDWKPSPQNKNIGWPVGIFATRRPQQTTGTKTKRCEHWTGTTRSKHLQMPPIGVGSSVAVCDRHLSDICLMCSACTDTLRSTPAPNTWLHHQSKSAPQMQTISSMLWLISVVMN